MEIGRQLFLNAPSRNGAGRSCNFCHANGGANDAAGNNRSFDTGDARAPAVPVCRGRAPGDGGFDDEPVITGAIGEICSKSATNSPVKVTFRGTGAFNTPPLVEAADTGPFFHNNSVSTIEEAVAFYNSDTFNNSPSGAGNAFALRDDQIVDIAAMLRTINVIENVRNGIALIKRATTEGNAEARETIKEALADTRDAIEVLKGAKVPIYPNTTIVSLLRQTAVAEQLALINPSRRKEFLALAIARKNQAQPQFTQ